MRIPFHRTVSLIAAICAGVAISAAGAAERQRGVDKSPTSPAPSPSAPPANNNTPSPGNTTTQQGTRDGPEGSRSRYASQNGQGGYTPTIPGGFGFGSGSGAGFGSSGGYVPGALPPGVIVPSTGSVIGSSAIAGSGARSVTGVTKQAREWRICNRSDEEVMKLTVIFGNGDQLDGSGWHTIEPLECLVSHSAAETGYYFATASQGQIFWGGESDLCASLRKWNGAVPRDCPEGYRMLPFKRVNLDKSEVVSNLE